MWQKLWGSPRSRENSGMTPWFKAMCNPSSWLVVGPIIVMGHHAVIRVRGVAQLISRKGDEPHWTLTIRVSLCSPKPLSPWALHSNQLTLTNCVLLHRRFHFSGPRLPYLWIKGTKNTYLTRPKWELNKMPHVESSSLCLGHGKYTISKSKCTLLEGCIFFFLP